MLYEAFAAALVVAHLAFIVFALLGGLFALRWRWMAWVHVPAALWGGVVALFGWICPLTPLENALRRAGGSAGYSGGFIDRYIVPLVYPTDLTREFQIALGLGLFGVNLVIYAFVWRRSGRS